MGIDVKTYAAARKYTDSSMAGGGAVAGKNCVVDSITDITGGHRVTFKWTLDNGTVQTGYMDVMDGVDGQDGATGAQGPQGPKGEDGADGLGIKSVAVNAQGHLIITYDDDTTEDAGEIHVTTAVDSVNGKTGDVELTASDVGALPDDTAIPSKISDLTNDSNFVADADYVHTDNNYDDTEKAKVASAITNTVNNLVNYYLKTETYTKTEVDSLISAISTMHIEAVSTLPTSDIKTNVIYLVPKDPTQTSNVKDEYINLDGTTAGWEKIGDTEIDLSGYVTTTALNTALSAYTTTIDLTALLADKVDKVTGKELSTNDYTNTDKELVDSIPNLVPISLVKDTVGWIGKNLLPYPYITTTKTSGGMTYTENGDGSVTANADSATSGVSSFIFYRFRESTLPKGKYIVTDEGASETNVYLALNKENDKGEYVADLTRLGFNGLHEVEFTVDYDGYTQFSVMIYARSGVTADNLKFYPMIRKANITDSTYEPYHESVEVMYEEEIHGVNLLKNTAVNKTGGNVAWVVNADKSITINTSESASSVQTLHIGEVTGLQGDYILNGVTGGSISTYGIQLYDVTTSTWITQYAVDGDSTINLADKNHTYRFTAYVRQGTSVSNITIRPMLRKAGIEDSTYRPYNEQAIQNQINVQGVLGAKNLLPQVEHANTTMTINGVTITSREDGSVLLNGTSTAAVSYHFIRLSNDTNRKFIKQVAGKKVTISGTNILNTDARVQFWSTTTNVIADTTGKGTTFTIPSDLATTDDYNFAIWIPSGSTLNNIIVYPMLRLASDPDDTYQPYAMTNRELMEKVNTLPREVFVTTDTRTTTTNDANTLPCGFTRMNDANSNLPTDGTGGNVWYDILTVRQSNDSSKATWGYGFQLAVQTTTNANMGDMYVRAVNGGETPTWSEWKKLN